MTITTTSAALLRRLAVALLCALALTAAAAATARAEFGLEPGSFRADVTDTTGAVEERAGVVPYQASVSFTFRTGADGKPDGNVKDIDVELPPGFIGNPQTLPRCSGAEWATVDGDGNPGCAAETQVGVATNTVDIGFPLAIPMPVYNLVPPPDAPAAFGFIVLGVPVTVVAKVRDADHGLTMQVRGISGSTAVFSSELTFWGVPADSRHDTERGRCLINGVGRCAARAPLTAFLSNPVDCDSGPLRTTLRVRSWQDPGFEDVATDDTDHAPSNCGRLSFRPRVEVTPETTRAGSPSGYEVTIAVPQGDDVRGRATATLYDDVVTSQLKDAVVTLPAGTSVSPSSADGLGACTPAQIGLGSSGEPACPQASKIGTVRIDNPLMSEPLTGGIFLAQPTDEQLLAIYLVAQGSGVTLKLPGTITPDPVSGQLTARFLDNPQLPFSTLTLRFKGGSRAPLVNPRECGPATTTATLTPWSAGSDAAPGTPVATPQSSFVVDGDGFGGACPASSFAPGFAAGVSNPTAGASSPFTLRLTRTDADQQFAAIARVSLPAGLLADVGSVPLCEEARAAAGTCGAESRVGTATVASGAGASPFQLGGQVALTGGYNGGDYGLSIAVPAQAGPFDLGTVVVRAAIHVNNDASLTVDADPLPTILKGIPLQLRAIDLAFDRPGFMQNPTSCAPLTIGAAVRSTAGADAVVSSPFRVGDCGALPFAPTIETTATAGDDGSAGLHVRVTQTPGQAHARSIAVTLPKGLTARLSTLRDPCTIEVARAGGCPARTRIGTATAVTPILGAPLSGPVLMVRGSNRLPDLLVQLRGAVDIDLLGTVVITPTLEIKSTFGQIPDVALTSFDLTLASGPGAALSRSNTFCTGDPVVTTAAVAHSGAGTSGETVLRTSGCTLRARVVADGTVAVVTVTAPAAGKLTLSGGFVKKATRTVTRGGNATVRLALTSKARRAIARRGKLAVAVKVGFAPSAGGRSSSARAKATFKRAKAKAKKAKR